MKRLSIAEYQSLTHNAQVLSRDEHGDKVLLLTDNRIIKLFRRKRLFSSTLLFPYALRFQRASRRLKELGIKSVDVQAVYRIRAIKRDAVVYRMLEGVGLREAVSDLNQRDSLLERLAVFLAELHRKGVYFRAIHFGNVVVATTNEFALIDISEARFPRGGLSIQQRARNFKPLVSYEEDRRALSEFGVTRFLTRYLDASGMDESSRQRFLDAVAAIDSVAFADARTIRLGLTNVTSR